MANEPGEPGEPVAGLMTRAPADDGDAFRALTEPHRDQLRAHCYRMLVSFTDADDLRQDTLQAAWQGLGDFEKRAASRDHWPPGTMSLFALSRGRPAPSSRA